MNYILQQVKVNGNADRFGGTDTKTDIAISDDVDKLKDYCKETYDQEAVFADEPEKFSWSYFRIIGTNLITLL